MFNVGIAELKTSRDPGDTLMALGLGSCVAVSVYDSAARVGGVLHFMLPCAKEHESRGSPLKFADTAVPMLLEELERLGGARGNMVARLAGGASMFPNPGGGAGSAGSAGDVGRRNVAAAHASLAQCGVRVAGEETGGHRGRTLKLEIGTGRTFVRSIGEPEKEI